MKTSQGIFLNFFFLISCFISSDMFMPFSKPMADFFFAINQHCFNSECDSKFNSRF